MYCCKICKNNMVETHIVCDFARAKNWWCEKQFAQCPHRERWFPSLLSACGLCVTKVEAERLSKKQLGIGEAVAWVCGSKPGDWSTDDGVGSNEDQSENDARTMGKFMMSTQTSIGGDDRVVTAPSMPERSVSVHNRATIWEPVENNATGPLQRERFLQEACKDAMAGLSIFRKRKWYKLS
jgi:hypothetical protein